MNLREAFERCFYEREGHPPSQMNIADIAAWQGFEMGAAHAARECAGIANSADKSTHPAVIADDILIAFPEAWK